MIRAARLSARPRKSSPTRCTSPVCNPMRTRGPLLAKWRCASMAARAAAPAEPKAAAMPSPIEAKTVPPGSGNGSSEHLEVSLDHVGHLGRGLPGDGRAFHVGEEERVCRTRRRCALRHDKGIWFERCDVALELGRLLMVDAHKGDIRANRPSSLDLSGFDPNWRGLSETGTLEGPAARSVAD